MGIYDLTGQTFGHWTVLEPAEPDKYGRAKWLCRCDCGEERVVTASNLRRGVSTSCGHTRGENHRKNLIGQRFGRLTVTRYVRYSSTANSSIWRCRCDCGKETDVSGRNLMTGHTTSCGCSMAEAQQSPAARVKALLESPLTGPYETNIRAKWYRVSNGAREWEIKNLSKFVRDHVELFSIDPEDKYEAKRTAKMLYGASYNHCRWNGWTVIQIEPNE